MQSVNEINLAQGQSGVMLNPTFQVVWGQDVFEKDVHVCEVPVDDQHFAGIVVGACVLLQNLLQAFDVDLIGEFEVGDDPEAEGNFEGLHLEELFVETQDYDHLFYFSQQGELLVQQALEVRGLDLRHEVLLMLAAQVVRDLTVHQEEDFGFRKRLKGFVLVKRRELVQTFQGSEVRELVGEARVLFEVSVEPVDFFGEHVGGVGEGKGGSEDDFLDQLV